MVITETSSPVLGPLSDKVPSYVVEILVLAFSLLAELNKSTVA